MKTVIRTIPMDIAVFCKAASGFPEGVKAAHEFLHYHFPLNTKYDYYGISKMEEGQLWYKAGISGISEAEAEALDLEKLILKSGQYASVSIDGFMKDVSAIRKAFDELLGKMNYDPEAYAVEWYNGDDQVDCLVKLI